MKLHNSYAYNQCDNKWCEYQTNVTPTCASINVLDHTKLSTGGITGRGVTICPFGYLDRITESGKSSITPYLQSASPRDTLFQPHRSGILPPQGDPRPLWRIGYQWRN